MAVVLGPILGYRGSDATTWRVSALVVMDSADKPKLTFTVKGQAKQTAADPETLAKFASGGSQHVVLRYDFEATRPTGKSEGTVDYDIDGQTNTFHFPGQKTPLQMAFGSCNGFSSASAVKSVPSGSTPLDRWTDLLKKHKRDAERGAGLHFHLLLMGGDQIYGDSVFTAVTDLQRWYDLDPAKQKKVKSTKPLEEAIDEHFFKGIYCARWSAEPVAKAMASIPSLMMWDDHDVFDGWGSYDADWMAAEVPQTIYRIAAKWFRVFQQRISATATLPQKTWPGSKSKSFSWFHRIDNVGILAPDLRSERSMDQILSSDTWDEMLAILQSFTNRATRDSADGLTHLLVLSSIPVIYPSFEYAETLLGWIPGHQDLEDDMRDHWRSRPHMGERRRLIRNLLNFATDKKTRVTILSGDVHVPAMGVVQSTRPEHVGDAASITQLISTGIVHTPPHWSVVWTLDRILSGFENEVERGITERMLELPDTGRRMLPKRNWLALEFSPKDDSEKDHKLWARWWLEGDEHAITKVIGAVSS